MDTVTIAIPLFPRFTALDGIGPYEVLQRIPGFDVTFIGREPVQAPRVGVLDPFPDAG